jgi:FkbM family methyltransferase
MLDGIIEKSGLVTPPKLAPGVCACVRACVQGQGGRVYGTVRERWLSRAPPSTMRDRLLVVVATLVCVHATSKFGHEVVSAFATALRQQPGRHALILDVGANNGHWGATVVTRVRRAAPQSAVELVSFEPQPQHQDALQRRAKKVGNTTVVAAAAWTKNTTLTFYLAERDSQASSTVETMARRFSGGTVRSGKRAVKRMQIPAISLGDFMRDRLRLGTAEPMARRPLVLLKLDVEASEYVVLPHLLVSGLACSVQYWLIEWHLSAQAPKQRLAGVLLRKSVDELLARGCPEPIVLEHDDASVNNNGRVPGLAEMAAEYLNRSSYNVLYDRMHNVRGNE